MNPLDLRLVALAYLRRGPHTATTRLLGSRPAATSEANDDEEMAS